MTDVTIGLETHVQLDTETKLFCGCPTGQEGGPHDLPPDEGDDRSSRNSGGNPAPNTAVCETCLGMPGSKPVVNAAAVDAAVRAGLALDCDIADALVFSRKTYFYPDMAKNFQMTQYNEPLASGGELDVDGETVRIRRAHLEEDPARIDHAGGDMAHADHTRVDYNRAGTPLLEVVTEPDLESPEHARTFLQKLVRIMEYLEVYDRDRFTVRSDANVSVDGGNRVEVKNITGTRAIAEALAHEIERQTRLHGEGKTVTRETRTFDVEAGVTRSVRSKETEEDYGYIFEPDLVPVEIDAERVSDLESGLPELPGAKRERFREAYGIGAELADSLVTDRELADAFEEAVEAVGADLAASWFSGPIKKTLNYHELTWRGSRLDAEAVVDVLERLDVGDLSDQAAETVIRELVEGGGDVASIVAEEGLEKAGGDELVSWVDEAIEDNPDAVDDYRDGDANAINFLVGQVMGKSGGSADPKEVRELLQERLD